LSTSLSNLDRQGQNVRSDGISLDGLRALYGSQAELYRRELEHISSGLIRAPYDANPRHRQWSPLYIADKTRRLAQTTRDTVARRAKPEGGLEMRETATDADAVPGASASNEAAFPYPSYYLVRAEGPRWAKRIAHHSRLCRRP
jgi:hypothetical protein